MSAETIIALERVSKRFGSTRAVIDVSFDVRRGRCLGWLGPNGSGKTTLIRCMLGLARVSEGTIHVRGHRIPEESRSALERVGGMVEEPRFYPYLSGRRNLQVWAAFYGGDARDRVGWALERVNLADRAASPVKHYSQGMRQRLGVARALLNDPELLILDEPSNGLDPAGIVEFRDMIRSFVEDDGRTVFVSSHLLDEVQKMADDIAIVNAGRLVTHGSVRELVAGGAQRIRLRVDDPAQAGSLLERLPFVSGVERVDGGDLRIELDRAEDDRAIELARVLVEAGVGVAELVQERDSLEQRFLDITAGSVPGAPGGAADMIAATARTIAGRRGTFLSTVVLAFLSVIAAAVIRAIVNARDPEIAPVDRRSHLRRERRRLHLLSSAFSAGFSSARSPAPTTSPQGTMRYLLMTGVSRIRIYASRGVALVLCVYIALLPAIILMLVLALALPQPDGAGIDVHDLLAGLWVDCSLLGRLRAREHGHRVSSSLQRRGDHDRPAHQLRPHSRALRHRRLERKGREPRTAGRPRAP